MGSVGPDTRDASLAHFGHPIAHACAACDVIRKLGPNSDLASLFGKIHDMLVQKARGRVLSEEEKRESMDPKALKKWVKAEDRKRRRLNAAVSGSPIRTRVRRAA